MSSVRFNLSALFHSIEAQRESRGLSRAALAREVGVSSSTLLRFADAKDAEADGVLALVRWLGSAPEEFVEDGATDAPSARLPLAGYVRVDMELVAKANGEARGARGRTRTTIQQLAQVAASSGQSIVSLTRVSEV